MARFHTTLSALCLFLVRATISITVNLDDLASVKSAASTITQDMMAYITTQPPYLLPYPPYFWWSSGAMFGTLIDYWMATGDSTYNNATSESILAQIGSDSDFMPLDQSFDMGNDDQAFWALTALTAAESNFQTPPKGSPSWLALAQAVFNEQISRWDNSTCGGGIHWQVYLSGGYSLKNSIANGALFQIATRLARYTQDDLYSNWAIKLWDWMWAIGLIDNENYTVYDSTDSSNNCTTLGKGLWSYNAGTMLVGAAIMFNITSDETWKNRTTHILNTAIFDYIPNGIMTEGCEVYGTGEHHCNYDQVNYKGFLSRWMAMTAQMAPFTEPTILPLLRSSATAAMEQCCGTDPNFSGNTACGRRWTMNSTWDGTSGPGQQLSALEVLIGTIIKSQPVPLTNSTGGTSVSDPTAGVNTSNDVPGSIVIPPTNSDRAGAWFVTAIILASSAAACYLMSAAVFETVSAKSDSNVPAVEPKEPSHRLSKVPAIDITNKTESSSTELGVKMTDLITFDRMHDSS